jgi:hypothetical protein
MSDGRRSREVSLIVVLTLVLCSCAASKVASVKLPEGYWSEEESQKILDKTLTIRLDPDLSHLSDTEREVVRILIEVGGIMHELYLVSCHHQALSSYDDLVALHDKRGRPRATQNLLDLYRLAEGPLVRDLDGEVRPFLPVDPRAPGRNVYPWGVTKEHIEEFVSRHPETKDQILDLRTVVRRATASSLERDLSTLEAGPDLLTLLHPGTVATLEALSAPGAAGEDQYYAVPYTLAYAEQILKVHELLSRAADLIGPMDIDFSRYLRHRALDLLTNNYEAGDAAWVTGRFKNLNAEIGSYEVYDDGLFGVKSFFAVSVLVKDRAMDESLNTAVAWLQEFEDMLPYEAHRSVRTDIPVGVYNVVADFGQARGTNTATILPNESYITRKYGRTILLRRNILENSDLFSARQNAYEAAVASEFHDAYKPEGDFFRTMFHEIGHYLGADLDRSGRSLDVALEEDSSIIEELKSDLVSLFLTDALLEKGYYDRDRALAVRAAGVRRVLRKNKPKKSQAYATMEVMQMNYYLEKGLLEYDAERNRLFIHFDEYHSAVDSMLREVLALQYNGDKMAADGFIDRYSTWQQDLHGRIADSMKGAEEYRYGLVRYAALGE